jgi:L-ectoine synthase
MIVRTLTEILKSARDVSGNGWQSRRLLAAEDQADFSLHDTLITAGAQIEVQISNQFEAVYILEGKGTIEPQGMDQIISLAPGTLYTVTSKDPHVLKAETAMRMICVFSPPCLAAQIAHQ